MTGLGSAGLWVPPRPSGPGLWPKVAAGRRLTYPWKIEQDQTIQPSEGACDVTPVPVFAYQPISGLAISVATAGSSGSIARLGLYRDSNCFAGSLIPGTEGTVITTSTGEKIFSFAENLLLAPGLYWPSCAIQGGAVTRAFLYAYDSGATNNAMFAFFHQSTVTGVVANNTTCFTHFGISGALPDPWTSTTQQAAAMIVGLVTA